MKIAVTGGTGFIGKYVVQQLLQHEIEVVVISTNPEKARSIPWFNKVSLIKQDLGTELQLTSMAEIASADKLIHLAWPGLPNYTSLFHFEETLLDQYHFIKKIVDMGVNDITIAGTCFEYGKKEGCLNEDMITGPENPYALAKDSLHKFLIEFQRVNPFTLKWVRLFYMYGPGQSQSSILSQLDKAIEKKVGRFNMSMGEQIRDYLPVEDVASKLIRVALHNEFNGTINCCSGKGITIKELVEKHLAEKAYRMELNLGYYPYNDYEPFKFWGDNSKWNALFT